MRFCVGLIAMLLSTSLVQSAVLLSEAFSYSDGPIVGASGSPWAAHNAGLSADISSNQLQLSSARGEDVNAALSGQPYGSLSGEGLYASFKVRFSALPTSAGTYFAHFKDSGSGFRARVWASTSGAAAGTFRIGIANSSGSAPGAQISTNLNLNTTYVLVIGYETSTGQSKLWLNPAFESDPSVSASDTTSTINVTSYAFRQNAGMGTLSVDDLFVGTSFSDVLPPPEGTAPIITTEPQSQTIAEGGSVTFSVAAIGSAPLGYRWTLNSNDIPGAMTPSLTLTNVTTNWTGTYLCIVTNAFGSATSAPVTLAVNVIPPYTRAALSVLTYNVKGNGATNWSTNSLQVQAIGRQLAYLDPDVITFQEIPYTLSHEMTNFINTYLPGYFLAQNSGTDQFIRSSIASRYPINRSKSWLDGMDLRPFGYTNENNSLDNFTRDLFEAEIAVPHFAQPLHVFTTHLKAGGTTDETAKRAAEASAISNYFVTAFLTTNANRPYVLTGDLNESDTNLLSIQRLVSPPTGLHLTTPLNPFTSNEFTWSIRANPNRRFDYIMPGGLLISNINNSQVFRTDLLNPTPPAILKLDDEYASDHLPVLMVFNNPYEGPFNLTSVQLTNQLLSLSWQSNTGRQYRVDSSIDLTNWTILASNLVANTTNFSFTTNVVGTPKFFRVLRNP